MALNPFASFAFSAAPVAPASPLSLAGSSSLRQPHQPAASPRPKRLLTSTAGAATGRKRRRAAASSEDDGAGGLPEKYATPGFPERRLRLLIVGHNPSSHAWSSGHYYSNPSNAMWRLLPRVGVVPPTFTAQDDGRAPIAAGVGFTDLGAGRPGTVSAAFRDAELHAWRDDFYQRLRAHARRAAATELNLLDEAQPEQRQSVTTGTAAAAASAAATTAAVAVAAAAAAATAATAMTATAVGAAALAGSACAASEGSRRVLKIEEALGLEAAEATHGPRIVAFSGKRQFRELFFDAAAPVQAQAKSCGFGFQALRPPSWPFPAAKTAVFVLTSSSGAAAMTNEAREGPYRELAAAVARFPWPNGEGEGVAATAAVAAGAGKLAGTAAAVTAPAVVKKEAKACETT